MCHLTLTDGTTTRTKKELIKALAERTQQPKTTMETFVDASVRLCVKP
jgi:nucleoid DNA-binding protein